MVLHSRLASMCVLILCLVEAVQAQSAPSDFTTAYRYDAMRQLVGTIDPDPDGTGPLHYAAVRNSYDGEGHMIKIEKGELDSWQSDSVAPSAWSGFSVLFVEDIVYDGAGRKIQDTISDGGSVYSTLTQYSYDAVGRPLCVAVRMNRSSDTGPYGALPSDACALSTETGYGPDRITRNSYDAAGQLTQITKAYGTSLQQNYATYSYTSNGRQESVTDANGNRTNYGYDGFDRSSKITFPSKTTPGSVNNDDYEAYGYDASSNRTSLRKRDGQVINYRYDTLNRAVLKSFPATPGSNTCADFNQAGPNDICYDYDNRGLMLDAKFGSLMGIGTNRSYDFAGRVLSETTYGLTISYQYDADGNRTRITWPSGDYATYSYDGLDRMSDAFDGTSQLAHLTYERLGRLTRTEYGGGAPAAIVSYSWSTNSDLLTLSHDFSDNSKDVSFTDTYNPARQIVQSGLNNALFLYAPQANGTTGYTANGLNQYATVTQPGSSATTMGYDANGNLTADGTYTFAYDPENRLLSASQGSIMSAAYSYDPMGRRSQKSVVGGNYAGTTVLLSSGDDEIADYCGNGSTLWHRYIPGPAVDQPLAAITYADSTCTPVTAVKSYFHQDKTGSIVAMSNASGTLAEGPYTYDPFGNCITGGQVCSGGIPYKYTGRRYDPETGLYYYRARYYSPTLGRFLQTDPIGYKDDLNWYAYVGNDPTDRTDATGEGIYGWVVKLTEKGLIRVRPLFDKSAAVTARRAGENVVVEGRQAAGSIERAAARNSNDVMRHSGHDLGDGVKGESHFQTEGKTGHTFYDAGGIVIGAIAILDAIDKLDPFQLYGTGCPKYECGSNSSPEQGDNPHNNHNDPALTPGRNGGNASSPGDNDRKRVCTGSHIATSENKPCR